MLLFDTETIPNWFSIPADSDLPGYHEIDCLRAWTNAETVDTWQGEYELKNNPITNNPTADYVSQFPDHVDEASPGPLYNRVWCKTLPASMPVGKRLTVDVDYVAATDNVEIIAELWAKDTLLGQGQSTVNAGFGTTSLTINLHSRPPEGADYEMRIAIRPHNADLGNYVDFCMRDFVVRDDIR